LGEAVVPSASLGHSGVNLRRQTPRAMSAPQTTRERERNTASIMHKRSIRFGSTTVCGTQSEPPMVPSSTASTASTVSTGSKAMPSSSSVGLLGSKVGSKPKPGVDSDQTLDVDLLCFSTPALGAEVFAPVLHSPRGTCANGDLQSPLSDTKADHAQCSAKQAVPDNRKVVNAELEAVSELVFDCTGKFPKDWEPGYEQRSHKDSHTRWSVVSSTQNYDGEDGPSSEDRIALDREAVITDNSTSQMPMDDEETF